MSRFPFTPYPNGWFVVAFSEELLPGQVLNCHYFGRDIVLYRTENGEAHAIDPHCPHLGAHLGHGGQVVDETLVCPFHGWCFDTSGRCVSVPRVPRPPRVSLTRWHLCEVDGLIFVYYHVQGATPDWDLTFIDSEDWSPNRTKKWRVRTHPQEVIENSFDMTHFTSVHGLDDVQVMRPPADEGHSTNLRMWCNHLHDDGRAERLELELEVHGLGILIVTTELVEIRGINRGRILATPVDEEFVDIRLVTNVPLLPDPDATAQMAQLAFDSFATMIARDIPIWENKIYIERPPLTRVDAPINVLRGWARRFYDA